MNHKTVLVSLLVALAATVTVSVVDAQGPKPTPPKPKAATANVGTAFTYQGQLKSGGGAVSNTCDFQFGMWDGPSLATQLGSTDTVTNVSVSNGLFTAVVNSTGLFGVNAFDGGGRWLDISVRCPAGGGGLYTRLTPRQALTPAPMAQYAGNGPFWLLTGNSGTTAGTSFVGTADNQPLEFKVNSTRAFRIEPNSTSPNLIGGYSGNSVTSGVVGATIGGGGNEYDNLNLVMDDFGTVSGGLKNTAGGQGATVSGGAINIASGLNATVAGGDNNTASGQNATVSGGYFNNASGWYATIPGGFGNSATMSYTLAAGSDAKAIHQGAFVWADSSGGNLNSTANNQFLVRATGGISLFTNSSLTTGCSLAAGSGTWACTSNKNVKANFEDVNARAILRRVDALPIQTWNYQTQDASIRHIGPMAQDFYSEFGVGENETTITQVDAEGVALAAIQGLSQIVNEKEARIAALEKQNAALELKNFDLDLRVTALEHVMKENSIAARTDSNLIPTQWLYFAGLVVVGLVATRRRS